ncbi:unnamed protein product [Ectocarpus sp. 13 AM-2016]
MPGGGGSQAGVGSPAAGGEGGGAAGGLGRTSPRSSSYGYFDGEEPSWEEYDRHVARQPGELENQPSAKGGGEKDTPLEATPSSRGAHPQQWDVWAEYLAYEAATKRLLRELRYFLGSVDALAPTAPNMAFALESLGAEGTGTGSNGGVARERPRGGGEPVQGARSLDGGVCGGGSGRAQPRVGGGIEAPLRAVPAARRAIFVLFLVVVAQGRGGGRGRRLFLHRLS